VQLIWDLFLAFARVGIFGYGGGPSVIPLLQREVVGRGWLTDTEFIDALAIGNALPGPIATKMSVYIGYKLAGASGMGAAMLGMLLPSTIAMLVVALFFFSVKDSPLVQAALTAVRPAVVGLLIWTAYDLGIKVIDPQGTGIGAALVRRWDWVLIVLVTFVSITYFRVHPALAILFAALVGVAIYR
jgi:chromate transporter